MSHGVVPPTTNGLLGLPSYFGAGGAAKRPGASGMEEDAEDPDERQALLRRGEISNSSNSRLRGRSSSGNGSGSFQNPASTGVPPLTLEQQHRGRTPQPLPVAGERPFDAGGRGSGGAAASGGSLDANSNKFESLDYELAENAVYRAEQAVLSHMDHIMQSAAKWGLCFLLGVITAIAAFAVNLSAENIAGFKFYITLTLLQEGRPLASFLMYVGINAALVVSAIAITVYWAPAAAGSGIAEVKAYLNGVDVPGMFVAPTLVAKMLGSVGAVAGGLAVGKEGPFVHAGACIGALLTQGGSRSRHLRWFKRFWNDRDRADLVACGAAAGIAAAFRSPVGGVLFALEEMNTWWRNQLLWFAFFTTAVVSVAVRVLMKLCTSGGLCGFFGSSGGGFLLYEITEGQQGFEVYELLPMLLLGVIGGLAGSTFNALTARLARWRQSSLARHGPRGRVLEGVFMVLLTSSVSFMLPFMVTCQPCPPGTEGACPRTDNAHSGNYVDFGCRSVQHRSGRYNDLANILFNTQDDAIRNLFSSRTKSEYSVSSLVTFTLCFYALAVASYGLSLPTGIFVPQILCGAAYGRLVGIFVADMHRGELGSIDEGTYALLGAASLLGGSMRLTVCTCVMLLELTSNLALLPLVMLVLLVAKAVGDGTGVRPIYETLMDIKDLPWLEPTPSALSRHMTAREAAATPPISLARIERVRTIVDALCAGRHNGFPVIAHGPDGDTYIAGVIARNSLVVLLRSKRALQPSAFPCDVAARIALSFTPADFAVPISAAGAAATALEGVRLSEEELGMFLDLGPYMNRSCYVVQEDANMSKVYAMFRALGLRHLCVVPRAQEVVGMITRADLLPHNLERRLLQAAQEEDGTGGSAGAGAVEAKDGGMGGERGRSLPAGGAALGTSGSGGGGSDDDGSVMGVSLQLSRRGLSRSVFPPRDNGVSYQRQGQAQ